MKMISSKIKSMNATSVQQKGKFLREVHLLENLLDTSSFDTQTECDSIFEYTGYKCQMFPRY